MVHPWVGQNVLKCNVLKTIFTRPTDTVDECREAARRGHSPRPNLVSCPDACAQHTLARVVPRATGHRVKAGAAPHDDRNSCTHPIETVSIPHCASSLDQGTRPRGGLGA